MLETIVGELKKIEQVENVRVLYACESGSRAWGFPSKDSDYDVRFIYAHPTEWYLTIDEKRDVIERPATDGLLDISGWELRKALKLFRNSNPPLLEWLESPIIYLEQYSTARKIRELSPLLFSPKNCLYHYFHMAEGNYREFLKKDQVRVKKYFYVLRPILCCMWIEKFNKMPPMEFEKLADELLAAGALLSEIKNLLRRKKSGEEMDVEPQITVINEFLEGRIAHFTEYIQTVNPKKADPANLDALFQDSLKEIWK